MYAKTLKKRRFAVCRGTIDSREKEEPEKDPGGRFVREIEERERHTARTGREKTTEALRRKSSKRRRRREMAKLRRPISSKKVEPWRRASSSLSACAHWGSLQGGSKCSPSSEKKRRTRSFRPKRNSSSRSINTLEEKKKKGLLLD